MQFKTSHNWGFRFGDLNLLQTAGCKLLMPENILNIFPQRRLHRFKKSFRLTEIIPWTIYSLENCGNTIKKSIKNPQPTTSSHVLTSLKVKNQTKQPPSYWAQTWILCFPYKELIDLIINEEYFKIQILLDLKAEFYCEGSFSFVTRFVLLVAMKQIS